MNAINILTDIEFSDYAPANQDDIAHDHINGVDVLTFLNPSGVKVTAYTETGSRYIVAGG